MDDREVDVSTGGENIRDIHHLLAKKKIEVRMFSISTFTNMKIKYIIDE